MLEDVVSLHVTLFSARVRMIIWTMSTLQWYTDTDTELKLCLATTKRSKYLDKGVAKSKFQHDMNI